MRVYCATIESLLSFALACLLGNAGLLQAAERQPAPKTLGAARVHKAVISSDGKFLLTELESFFDAFLWDLPTGRRLQQTFSLRIIDEGFSLDGSLVFTSGFRSGMQGATPFYSRYVDAWLWNAKTGEKLATYEHNDSHVPLAAFSVDNQYLLFSDFGGTARLYDLRSDKKLGEYEANSSQPSVGFAPKGAAFFTGHSLKLTVWDRHSLEKLCEIKAPGTSFQTASFAADSDKLITGCFDGRVIVWNAKTGEPTRTIESHSSFVTVAKVVQDGKRLVTTSANRFYGDWKSDWSKSPHLEAKLWDMETGKLIRKFTHAGPIDNAQLSDDGTRLLTTWHRPMAEGRPYTRVRYTDLAATLWDVETGTEILNVELNESPAIAVLSRNGDRVFTEGPAMRLWDARMGQLIREYPKAK